MNDLMRLLVPLPVILPLLGAGATLMLSHRPRAQEWDRTSWCDSRPKKKPS